MKAIRTFSPAKWVFIFTTPLVGLFLFMIFRATGPESKAVSGEILRRDREPLEKRLPLLSGFRDCYWIGGVMGVNDNSRVPGPTDIFIRGFIILKEEQVSRIKAAYSWDIATPPAARLTVPNLTVPASGWKSSKPFGVAVKGTRLGGEILVHEDGMLYFDLMGR